MSSASAERGSGRGHLQGAGHIAAARLACGRTMVGTGWANSWSGCMNGFKNTTSTL